MKSHSCICNSLRAIIFWRLPGEGPKLIKSPYILLCVIFSICMCWKPSIFDIMYLPSWTYRYIMYLTNTQSVLCVFYVCVCVCVCMRVCPSMYVCVVFVCVWECASVCVFERNEWIFPEFFYWVLVYWETTGCKQIYEKRVRRRKSEVTWEGESRMRGGIWEYIIRYN